jgi:hypothetical protein
MHYKEADKESVNRLKRDQKSEPDLEDPNLNNPLFSDNDRDPNVEPGEWNYESLF